MFQINDWRIYTYIIELSIQGKCREEKKKNVTHTSSIHMLIEKSIHQNVCVCVTLKQIFQWQAVPSNNLYALKNNSILRSNCMIKLYTKEASLKKEE